jgi:hypothetical protein
MGMDEEGNLLLADFDWLHDELSKKWIKWRPSKPRLFKNRIWGEKWSVGDQYNSDMEMFAKRFREEFDSDLFYIHMLGTPYERSFRVNVRKLIRTLNKEAQNIEEFEEEERLESFRRDG